jgi:Bacterial pre-peptidase C-terminal domain
MNRYLSYAVAAAFAAGSLATSVAHAVIEMESNDAVSTPQPLPVINGSVEVTGSIGNTSPSLPAVADVDFYSFEATEGDVVQIDINGGMKDFASGSRAVDTVIAVFASDLAFTLLRQNDDADDTDLGSISTSDSRIVDFVVPATGKYLVGVSSFPRTFNDMGGGGLTSTGVDQNVGNGSYTLTVTGVTTPPPVAETPPPPAEEPPPPVVTPAPPGQAKEVGIDIRPRDSRVARVYPNADGSISVAILSSSTFDAMKIDKYSMTFGAEGDELSYVGCHKEGIDVNRDRRKDLVCRFNVRKAGFDVGDIEGVLKGTVEGSQFEGRGPVKVVMKGKKRKHQHHHHGRDHDNRGHGGWHSRRD